MDRVRLAHAFGTSPVELRGLTMGEARAMWAHLAEVARARARAK